MHLLKLCCRLCCSPEYLQHAFFVLLYKILENYFLLHAVLALDPCLICFVRRRNGGRQRNQPTCRTWLIRLAAFVSWRNRPDFAFALLSTGSFAPIVKWGTRPHGLFAMPAALHTWERTCHLKHCRYVIFASNTDGIRGVSIVNKTDVGTPSIPRPLQVHKA